jgi:hypothetical protein
MVTTRGGPSCGEWVQDRRANGTPDTANGFWLLGYMSGLASGMGKDILQRTDAASIYLWMDNYCKANPLNKVGQGGNTLSDELAQKLTQK